MLVIVSLQDIAHTYGSRTFRRCSTDEAVALFGEAIARLRAELESFNAIYYPEPRDGEAEDDRGGISN